MDIQYKLLNGKDLAPFLDPVAKLRIAVFKEFPYLYDGDMAYERKYLGRYLDTPRSLVAIAIKDGGVVGATTCIPLADEVDDFKLPFLRQGQDLSKIFYFGESLILKDYRGNRIGHKFFEIRETYAKKTVPDLRMTTFCAVHRPENHPLRPKEYRPLDKFWNRMGYAKDPQLTVNYPWKDIDKIEEDEKTLVFWKKNFVS